MFSLNFKITQTCKKTQSEKKSKLLLKIVDKTDLKK